MKCRNQLAISSKFNIANEYVLCRYKWHRPIVLIGHSFVATLALARDQNKGVASVRAYK
jgi:hypothetical protein